jgi:hypothetical protein
MTLIQELMNQAAVGGLLSTQEIQRFTPAEIRETIQSFYNLAEPHSKYLFNLINLNDTEIYYLLF